MGVRLIGGTLESGSLTVGADAELLRNGESLGTASVSGIMVGGKLLDEGKAGQAIEFPLRGPAAALVQVGDRLRFS